MILVENRIFIAKLPHRQHSLSFLQLQEHIDSFLLRLESTPHRVDCVRSKGRTRLMPATFSDCPYALLIDIADVRRAGNCSRLNSNGISVGIIGIPGRNTSSPFVQPVRMVASIT
jgi:hypothetical protein